ncbi:hypothetical protein PVK06_048615 [Gossypium arboreum]|uniref:Aminotransferase-like plant mobile domain-containing protein n=1 Tax=Gossypium arboreum TaxID=29729 RepID=A0ABR0MGI7_GOSAR|nr:hypothetical protein PVK06_048615 [Gossypium arboreum]
MANDRVLEGFKHNMGKPPILQICGYLQEAGFLHTSRMLKGCKLNPTLISVLVERWMPETHTFHITFDECTITLHDVALQLGLLVDGPIVIGSAVVPVVGLMTTTVSTSQSDRNICVPVGDEVEPWAEFCEIVGRV